MKKLFEDLMALQKENDFSKFYFKDFESQFGTKLRVFTYHFASYSDWLLPGALESRGIMFELDKDNNPVRIVARPMEKFFNYGEHNVDINNLCKILIEQGLLSQDVYDNAKGKTIKK